MKTHKEKEFLTWASNHGIGVDDRYPRSAVLTFKPDPDCDRFWGIPIEPERRPYFIASVFEAMSEWTSCFVWRHMGSWPASPDPQKLNDRIEYQILKGIDIPLGTADVVELDRTELDALATLVFSTSIFGWSVGEDLYIVPNTGLYIAKTDHHGVIHVSFRSFEQMQNFVGVMSERDFHLPDNVPDSTFKRPEWMKK